MPNQVFGDSNVVLSEENGDKNVLTSSRSHVLAFGRTKAVMPVLLKPLFRIKARSRQSCEIDP